MVNIVSIKELRPTLPEVVNNIDTKLDRYIVTKRGKAVVVMISVDDYVSLLETLEVLSDKEAMKRIKIAKREIKEGNTTSLADVRRRLESV